MPKKTRTLPSVMGSRLASALSRHGVNVPLGTAIAITAEAFGYHNAHEFQAAARSGKIGLAAPAQASSDSLADHIIMQVMTDPKTGIRFAVEPQGCTGHIINSPSGSLMRPKPETGSPTLGITLITNSPDDTTDSIVETLEQEPSYPRAIAICDYADIQPFIFNDNSTLMLDDDQQITLAMRLIADNRDDIREAMVRAITAECENIWNRFSNSPDLEDDIQVLLAEEGDANAHPRMKEPTLIFSPPFRIGEHPETYVIEINTSTEEGINGGDYDPVNPEETEAMRFTLLKKTGFNEFEQVEQCSYATLIPTISPLSRFIAFYTGLSYALQNSDGSNIVRICREYTHHAVNMIAPNTLSAPTVGPHHLIDTIKDKSGTEYTLVTNYKPATKQATISLYVKEAIGSQTIGYYHIPDTKTVSYLNTHTPGDIYALHAQAIHLATTMLAEKQDITNILSILAAPPSKNLLGKYPLPENTLYDIADYAYETDPSLAQANIESHDGWESTIIQDRDTSGNPITKYYMKKTFYYIPDDQLDDEATRKGTFTIALDRTGRIADTSTEFS